MFYSILHLLNYEQRDIKRAKEIPNSLLFRAEVRLSLTLNYN